MWKYTEWDDTLVETLDSLYDSHDIVTIFCDYITILCDYIVNISYSESNVSTSVLPHPVYFYAFHLYSNSLFHSESQVFLTAF